MARAVAIVDGRPTATEFAEQAAVMQWARMTTIVVAGRVVPLTDHLYAVPNGAAINMGRFTEQQRKARIRRLLEIGFAPGALDLNLDVARGKWHGMRIEMKSHRGTVSDDQHRWIERHMRAGYYATVAHGASVAIQAIRDYLRVGTNNDLLHAI